MLTNPSPNPRTPWAVSRRRTLRRSRSEPLIGVLQKWTYLKNFAAHSERSNGYIRKSTLGAVGLGCALWSSYHHSALAAAACSVSSRGERFRGACCEATLARTGLDRSSVGLMCDRVRSSRAQFAVSTRDVRPVDYRHKRIDIGGGSRPVIHVIRVLIHVECEDRLAAGERRRVVHRPLIDELGVARRPSEQHPSRATALCLAHRGEFSPPAIDAPKIAGERVAQLAFRRALVTERGEEQLMEDRRVARDQLLAFETVDHKTGRFREIKFGELRRDGIEAIDRTTVIVFVMTDDQLL